MKTDWSQCTFEGSRLASHRAFAELPFSSKMEALESLCELSLHFLEGRKRRGEPYIDPYTKEVVRPASSPIREGGAPAVP